MPSSHDMLQDRHLANLDREVANLRKRIQANVHTMNKIAKDVNARLAALETAQPAPSPTPSTTSRRKTPGKGAKIK